MTTKNWHLSHDPYFLSLANVFEAIEIDWVKLIYKLTNWYTAVYVFVNFRALFLPLFLPMSPVLGVRKEKREAVKHRQKVVPGGESDRP